MDKSLYIEYVDKYLKPLVLGISDQSKEQGYLHKTMLRPQYTPTLKWSSLSKKNQSVVADVVSMDSSLPLKRRDKIESAQGKVPKIGMKKYLGEEEMTRLDIIESQNTDGALTTQVHSALFEDLKECQIGVYEQHEAMFLQALSTGVTTINEENNEGVAIRLDYGFPSENFINANATWAGGTGNVITDINEVMTSARVNGDRPRYMLMGPDAYENFVKSAEMKELYAANIGFAGDNIPKPNREQVNVTLRAEYGLEVMVVDRTVTYEKNGVRQVVEPFDDKNVVFLTSLQVGSLVWGTLAEMRRPLKAATYATADSYILLSKYRKNDPLREFTSSQTLSVPVIENVESIYVLQSETTG